MESNAIGRNLFESVVPRLAEVETQGHKLVMNRLQVVKVNSKKRALRILTCESCPKFLRQPCRRGRSADELDFHVLIGNGCLNKEIC